MASSLARVVACRATNKPRVDESDESRIFEYIQYLENRKFEILSTYSGNHTMSYLQVRLSTTWD